MNPRIYFIISALVASLMMLQANAINPNPDVRAELKKQMTYPAKAIETSTEGTVSVIFVVEENGLNVKFAGANNAELKQYVVNKLRDYNVPKESKEIGNVISMKFHFQLI